MARPASTPPIRWKTSSSRPTRTDRCPAGPASPVTLLFWRRSIITTFNPNRSIAAALTCAVLWPLATGPAAQAESRAHLHGVGQLNIAIEGQHVEMELVVPGADIVGFEHAPSTESDKRAVQEASHKLEDGKKIVSFPPAAKCDFEKVEVQSTLLGDHGKHDDHGKNEKHVDHAHEKKGHHKDDHDHDKKAHHKDDHHKEEHHKVEHGAKEVHGEFRVHYHVECARMADLTHLGVTFFKAFPTAEKLVTRWIFSGGQGAATLTASNTRLKF